MSPTISGRHWSPATGQWEKSSHARAPCLRVCRLFASALRSSPLPGGRAPVSRSAHSEARLQQPRRIRPAWSPTQRRPSRHRCRISRVRRRSARRAEPSAGVPAPAGCPARHDRAIERRRSVCRPVTIWVPAEGRATDRRFARALVRHELSDRALVFQAVVAGGHR